MILSMSKGRLLIRPMKNETINEYNLYIPRHYKRLSSFGEVVGVSEIGDDFDFCKVGDIVVYDKYCGYEIKLNGERLEIVENTDIVCVINGSDIKIPLNHVLIRLISKKNQNRYSDLTFDISWQKERFNHTFAKVELLPQKFVYSGSVLDDKELYSDNEVIKHNTFSLKFEESHKPTIQVGDIVHFHYLAVEGAEVAGYVIEEKSTGERLYIIRYDLCYAYERNNDITFINGFLGVEIDENPTSEQMESGLFSLNMDERNKKKWGKGVVKFISEPNKSYLMYDTKEDEVDIKVGDYIGFKKSKKMQIGNDAMLENDKLKGITLIQRKDINFVIN